MPAPIALQLYTVREALDRDFEGTVERVAGLGYAGVETATFPGTTPAKARKLFDRLGLAVMGAHLPLPLGDKKSEVIDTAVTLGCTRLICPMLRAEEHYSSLDQIKRTSELVNQANAVAAEYGLSLGMHNHWWEYEEVEGQYPNVVLAELVDPTVFFEIDTYWAKTAGADPIPIINGLGKRAPLLHIKDGPAVKGEPMVAAGEGVMDIPGIVAAGADSTEWLVIELDACTTDMMEAVEKSYRYMVGNGLAEGKK